MTLLDASALLVLLLGQPGDEEVADLLRGGDCAIPAPCLAEVVDQLVRRRGAAPAEVAERLGPLLDEALAVLPVDSASAWRAGELRAERYEKRAALSLADCMLLACAGEEDRLVSGDEVLLATAADLGLATVPLGQ